ncbi:hypothetical protein PCK2_000918 [Pneumocystis canis]|nr:hypothetical protein PCK2_000918 [Pneumocystis canis]
MYEVQKSGEKFEKYKDNLFKDDISSSSQRKFKRPLIAKNEIRNKKYSLKECTTRASDDAYHIAYVKGKSKENNGTQFGFLQKLLNDISNASTYSSQSNSNIQASEKCRNKIYDDIGSYENNSTFVPSV